jgi:hypothetical protein
MPTGKRQNPASHSHTTGVQLMYILRNKGTEIFRADHRYLVENERGNKLEKEFELMPPAHDGPTFEKNLELMDNIFDDYTIEKLLQ